MCTATRCVPGPDGSPIRCALTVEFLSFRPGGTLVSFLHLVSGQRGAKLRFLHPGKCAMEDEAPPGFNAVDAFAATHPHATVASGQLVPEGCHRQNAESFALSDLHVVRVMPGDGQEASAIVPFTVFESDPLPTGGEFAVLCHMRHESDAYDRLVRGDICTVDGPGLVVSQLRNVVLPGLPLTQSQPFEQELGCYESRFGLQSVPEDYDVVFWSEDRKLPRVTYHSPTVKWLRHNPSVCPLALRAFRAPREERWQVGFTDRVPVLGSFMFVLDMQRSAA